MHDGFFHLQRLLRCQHGFEMMLRVFREFRGSDIENGFPNHLLARTAGELLKSAIDEQIASLEILEKNDGGRVVQYRIEQRPAVLDLSFHSFARFEITADECERRTADNARQPAADQDGEHADVRAGLRGMFALGQQLILRVAHF